MNIAINMIVVGLWVMIASLLGIVGAAMCNFQALACTLLYVCVIAGYLSIIGLVIMLTITIIDT